MTANPQFQDEAILIYRVGNRYRLVAGDSGLSSEGDELSAAYADLQQMIALRQADQPARSEIGTGETAPLSGTARGMSLDEGLRRVLQVATLMLVISLLPLMFFATSALSNVSGLLTRFKAAADLVAPSIATGNAVSGSTGDERRTLIVRTIHNVAQDAREVTPERKQQVLEDVRAIVRAAQPFADAVRPLFTAVPEDLSEPETSHDQSK
jgi:hypothetical protein